MKKKVGWLLVSSKVMTLKKSRLFEEAAALSITLIMVTPDDFLLTTDTTKNSYSTRKKTLSSPDFVIPLVVDSNVDTALRVLQHLETMSIPLLNTPDSIRLANDKFATYQRAKELGICIPKTTLLLNSKAPKGIIFPQVIKPNNGSKAQAVSVITNHSELKTYLQKHSHQENILQEIITTSVGKDVRVVVLDNKVVGTIERSNPASFTSNGATGGQAVPTTINSEILKKTLLLVKKMGLTYCSVDFLYGKNTLVLCEVNANPGFKLIEKATGINMASAILKKFLT